MAAGDQVAKLEHQQRLALLGEQLAGLTHDLKSPIAATASAASIVGDAIADLQRLTIDLHVSEMTADQQSVIEEMLSSLVSDAPQAAQRDPLEQSDQELEIATWLDQHAVANSWELAPALLEAGWDVEKLSATMRCLPEGRVEAIVRWLHAGIVVQEAIQTIEVAVSELRERTTAISDLSRNEQASGEAITLSESLGRAQRLFRHELGQLDFAIDFDASTGEKLIPRNLTQVWTNLIGNAVDALDGKGQLRIDARSTEGQIEITFRDDGPGIPSELLDQIFDPYVTSKPAGKGTGLGLNISRQIINRAGGTIELVSHPGSTIFTVHLPCSAEGESSSGS